MQLSWHLYLFNIQLPSNTQIDLKLILGSVIFGIGWGIAGICPAPSFTLLGLGDYEVLYFIIAMLLGVLFHRWCFKAS